MWTFGVGYLIGGKKINEALNCLQSQGIEMYTFGYQTKGSEHLPIDKVIVKNWPGHWSRM